MNNVVFELWKESEMALRFQQGYWQFSHFQVKYNNIMYTNSYLEVNTKKVIDIILKTSVSNITFAQDLLIVGIPV